MFKIVGLAIFMGNSYRIISYIMSWTAWWCSTIDGNVYYGFCTKFIDNDHKDHDCFSFGKHCILIQDYSKLKKYNQNQAAKLNHKQKRNISSGHTKNIGQTIRKYCGSQKCTQINILECIHVSLYWYEYRTYITI